MPKISIIDSANSVQTYGIHYPYLKSRLEKALLQVGAIFEIVPIAAKLVAVSDVTSVLNNKDEFLAVLFGKGQERLVKNLALAANARKEGLDEQIKQMFSDKAGAAGFTVVRVSFVPVVRCSPFESDQESNRTFVSNVLVHEVGHALSGAVAAKDHESGGVMKPTIESNDGELWYSSSFVKALKKQYVHAPSAKRGR